MESTAALSRSHQLYREHQHQIARDELPIADVCNKFKRRSTTNEKVTERREKEEEIQCILWSKIERFSISVMASAAKKVLVPVANGTEPLEAVITIDVLRRAGADVTVASVEKQLCVDACHGVKIVGDALISDCADTAYDLISLPRSGVHRGQSGVGVRARADGLLIVSQCSPLIRSGEVVVMCDCGGCSNNGGFGDAWLWLDR
ncbi:unnamed protein product [Fraxinus pennsylvanica]|uniref:DJ-1/PfpI domain-containing protein n=1 Tax=Fraxinus pennsylvanica TaxID=56036 RepID=A0AAD1YVR7_9LAMI|nr:unnamed protein product [Fraxinus pennsylvanica]